MRCATNDPGGGSDASLTARIEDAVTNSSDLRFSGAVASFGMYLRGERRNSLEEVRQLAAGACGDSAERQEFVQLVRQAEETDGLAQARAQ